MAPSLLGSLSVLLFLGLKSVSATPSTTSCSSDTTTPEGSICGTHAYASSSRYFLQTSQSGAPVSSLAQCALYCSEIEGCGGFFFRTNVICQPFSGDAAQSYIANPSSPYTVYDLSCYECVTPVDSTTSSTQTTTSSVSSPPPPSSLTTSVTSYSKTSIPSTPSPTQTTTSSVSSSPPPSSLTTSVTSYSNTSIPSTASPTPTGPLICYQDNCLRAFLRYTSDGSNFCATYTTTVNSQATGIPSFLDNCGGTPSALSSGCSCLYSATATTSLPLSTSISTYHNSTITQASSTLYPNTTIAQTSGTPYPNTTISQTTITPYPSATLSSNSSVPYPNTTITQSSNTPYPNTTVSLNSSTPYPNTTIAQTSTAPSRNATTSPPSSIPSQTILSSIASSAPYQNSTSSRISTVASPSSTPSSTPSSSFVSTAPYQNSTSLKTSGVVSPSSAPHQISASSITSNIPSPSNVQTSSVAQNPSQTNPVSSGLGSSTETESGTVVPESTTSTIYKTSVYTTGGHLTTETIAVSTTVCPVTESPSAASVFPEYTTSTVRETKTYTITSCAATVTDCPARIGKVTTETIDLYTTICPVTEAENSSGKTTPTSTPPASSPASGTPYTTSTVYGTKIYTITSCAPRVMNCPLGKVTTETEILYTTYCPVSGATSVSALSRETTIVQLSSGPLATGNMATGASSQASVASSSEGTSIVTVLPVPVTASSKSAGISSTAPAVSSLGQVGASAGGGTTSKAHSAVGTSAGVATTTPAQVSANSASLLDVKLVGTGLTVVLAAVLLL